MSFLSKRTQTARKHHRCCETGAVIKPGTKYVTYSGISEEGDFFSVKMLAPIAELCDRVNFRLWESLGYGLPFGSLAERVFDNLTSDDEESLADAEAFLAPLSIEEFKWMRVRLAGCQAAYQQGKSCEALRAESKLTN